MTNSKLSVNRLVYCALFAAITAALAQVSIPIGPVPVNIAHVAIFIAAGLLGSKYAALSVSVYVLLGAAGVPVFSGFRGGLGIVAGATGGFIIGYILCAFITGLIIEKTKNRAVWIVAAILCGWIATYIPGIIWFTIVTGRTFAEALSLCVLPFIPGDIAKTALCTVLILRFRRVRKV